MFSRVRRYVQPTAKFDRLPWTTINLRSRSPATQAFIPDKYGMNLLYGKGWSAASGFTRHDTCYIALTIAGPVSDVITAVSAYRGTPFINTLLSDPGLEEAKGFSLTTATRTVTGRGRIVLIGDAAHGMVPFCGAGASSGVKDGTEIAKLLARGHPSPGEIECFNKDLRKRNDTLIGESRRLLWVAQGERLDKRVIRRIVFEALEMGERLGDRRKMDKVLRRLITGQEEEALLQAKV